MKNPIQPILAATLIHLGGIAVASEPQPQIVFTPGTGATWNADWDGVAGRTYFLQCSLDLVTWMYAPIVDFGTNPDSYGVDTDGETKVFVRLKYVDADWVSSKLEAENADFDNDGIPNWYEVEILFSDPLDGDSAGGDSDTDGMADGWELYYFANLTTADPNAKLTPDGLTNKEKSQLGLSPLSDDLTSDTERITYSYDGERLDIVNYYSQREFDYGLDDNGNVETTTSN